MLNRRILKFALVPALSIGLACLSVTQAQADDEPAPKRKRIRIQLPSQGGQTAPGVTGFVLRNASEPEKGKAKVAPKNPMTAVMRWAVGEMGAQVGGAAGDAGAYLEKWFDGGSDVPMSGLRDALKADGWTAASLQQWMAQQMLQSAPQMMQLFSGGAHGPSFPRQALTARKFSMAMPFLGGHENQGGQAGCPHCGSDQKARTSTWFGQHPRAHGGFDHGSGRGQARGQGRRRGQGGMRRWHRRGGQQRGGQYRGGQQRGGQYRGGQHQGGQHRGGPAHGGMTWGGMAHGAMGHGPMGPHMQTQGHTFLLWNDGTGWRRSEMPHGPMGGRRAGPGQGGMHRGPLGHGPSNHGPMGMGSGQMPEWLGQLLRDGTVGPNGPKAPAMGPGMIHGHKVWQHDVRQHDVPQHKAPQHGAAEHKVPDHSGRPNPNPWGAFRDLGIKGADAQSLMEAIKQVRELQGEGKTMGQQLEKLMKDLGVDTKGLRQQKFIRVTPVPSVDLSEAEVEIEIVEQK